MTNRVKALEEGVAKLDEVEFEHFAKWFASYQDRVWEKRFAKDAKAGRLDFLIEEARSQRESGALRDI